jgi:hypothetical protein
MFCSLTTFTAHSLSCHIEQFVMMCMLDLCCQPIDYGRLLCMVGMVMHLDLQTRTCIRCYGVYIC